MDLVKDQHTIGEAPQADEVVAHRQDGHYGLVDRPNTVFGKERPLLVREPFPRTDTPARSRIENTRDAQILKRIVQERRTVGQLQVDVSIRAQSSKKLQDAREHGIPGGPGRERHIETAMPETPLEFQVGQESRFGLALSHGGLEEQDAGSVHRGQDLSGCPLQGTRPNAEDLFEGPGQGRKRDPWSPPDGIESPFGTVPTSPEPVRQVSTILRPAEGKPFFVGPDPVGETRETGHQHEFRTCQPILARNPNGFEKVRQDVGEAQARCRPIAAAAGPGIALQVEENGWSCSGTVVRTHRISDQERQVFRPIPCPEPLRQGNPTDEGVVDRRIGASTRIEPRCGRVRPLALETRARLSEIVAGDHDHEPRQGDLPFHPQAGPHPVSGPFGLTPQDCLRTGGYVQHVKDEGMPIFTFFGVRLGPELEYSVVRHEPVVLSKVHVPVRME